ncbi:hypothetical protein Tco_0923264 [Tanacetum coccineum]|uniref:Uncharacterized protein n=1 Tax=Tanacetum coccineum TaxID=301880 RepID=A0ABQ5D1V9_9ASTR
MVCGIREGLPVFELKAFVQMLTMQDVMKPGEVLLCSAQFSWYIGLLAGSSTQKQKILPSPQQKLNTSSYPECSAQILWMRSSTTRLFELRSSKIPMNSDNQSSIAPMAVIVFNTLRSKHIEIRPPLHPKSS